MGTSGPVHLFPVAVPGGRLADGAASLPTDRCHSLRSLLSVWGARYLPCRNGCVSYRPQHTLIPCCICHWQRRGTRPPPAALPSLPGCGALQKLRLTEQARFLQTAAHAYAPLQLPPVSCCGARWSPCRRSGFVAHRPLPLAHLALSATSSARIAPLRVMSNELDSRKAEESDQKAGILPSPRRPDADRPLKTSLRQADDFCPCRSQPPPFPGKIPISRNHQREKSAHQPPTQGSQKQNFFSKGPLSP